MRSTRGVSDTDPSQRDFPPTEQSLFPEAGVKEDVQACRARISSAGERDAARIGEKPEYPARTEPAMRSSSSMPKLASDGLRSCTSSMRCKEDAGRHVSLRNVASPFVRPVPR